MRSCERSWTEKARQQTALGGHSASPPREYQCWSLPLRKHARNILNDFKQPHVEFAPRPVAHAQPEHTVLGVRSVSGCADSLERVKSPTRTYVVSCQACGDVCSVCNLKRRSVQKRATLETQTEWRNTAPILCSNPGPKTICRTCFHRMAWRAVRCRSRSRV